MGCHNSTQLNSIKHILRNIENYAEGTVIERAEFFPCKELAALCRGTVSKEVMRVWKDGSRNSTGRKEEVQRWGGRRSGGQFPGFSLYIS